MRVARTLPLLVFGVTVLVTMGVTSVTPILPRIATVFSVPLTSASLLITAFALPGLLLTPLLGVWADRFGRKALLVPSLLIFAFAGLGCALSDSFESLIFFRAVQGLGGAPLGLLYSTIIADSWEKEDRARMMSYAAVVLGLGTGLSPAVGGVLGMFSWRYTFLLSLLALPVAILAIKAPLLIPKSRDTLQEYTRHSLDCITRPLTRRILALSLLASIMLCGPLITGLPIHLDKVFAASPLTIGVLMACASLSAGLTASTLSRLYVKFTTRQVLLFGQIGYFLCFCIIPFAPWLYVVGVGVIFYGLGQGLTMPVLGTLLAGQAPAEQRAALLSVNSLFLRASQAFAPAAVSVLSSHVGSGVGIASGLLLVAGTMLLLSHTELPRVTD